MNRYAVTVKVGDEQVTRIEHAESPSDAMSFAAANLNVENPGVQLKLLHVGPPPEDVERFEAALNRAIADKMETLLGEKK